jgi:hypothetical protein
MSQPPPPPSQPEPFPVQAAKFSLYVPIVIVVLNCVLNSTLNKPNDTAASTSMNHVALLLIGILCQLGLVAGLVLGIVALFGIKKHGAKRILPRAITGILLNAFFLAASIAVLVMAPYLRR